MIFQSFSQNKYKRKRENRCHVTLKPLKGGRANGFGSSRSLNNRFCGLGRKNEFGPKLREAERTFSLFVFFWPVYTIKLFIFCFFCIYLRNIYIYKIFAKNNGKYQELLGLLAVKPSRPNNYFLFRNKFFCFRTIFLYCQNN